jgi:hypothetical protein
LCIAASVAPRNLPGPFDGCKAESYVRPLVLCAEKCEVSLREIAGGPTPATRRISLGETIWLKSKQPWLHSYTRQKNGD